MGESIITSQKRAKLPSKKDIALQLIPLALYNDSLGALSLYQLYASTGLGLAFSTKERGKVPSPVERVFYHTQRQTNELTVEQLQQLIKNHFGFTPTGKEGEKVKNKDSLRQIYAFMFTMELFTYYYYTRTQLAFNKDRGMKEFYDSMMNILNSPQFRSAPWSILARASLLQLPLLSMGYESEKTGIEEQANALVNQQKLDDYLPPEMVASRLLNQIGEEKGETAVEDKRRSAELFIRAIDAGNFKAGRIFTKWISAFPSAVLDAEKARGAFKAYMANGDPDEEHLVAARILLRALDPEQAEQREAKGESRQMGPFIPNEQLAEDLFGQFLLEERVNSVLGLDRLFRRINNEMGIGHISALQAYRCYVKCIALRENEIAMTEGLNPIHTLFDDPKERKKVEDRLRPEIEKFEEEQQKLYPKALKEFKQAIIDGFKKIPKEKKFTDVLKIIGEVNSSLNQLPQEDREDIERTVMESNNWSEIVSKIGDALESGLKREEEGYIAKILSYCRQPILQAAIRNHKPLHLAEETIHEHPQEAALKNNPLIKNLNHLGFYSPPLAA